MDPPGVAEGEGVGEVRGTGAAGSDKLGLGDGAGRGAARKAELGKSRLIRASNNETTRIARWRGSLRMDHPN